MRHFRLFLLPSLKLTANAPTPSQKETRKSSNHPFSGANSLLVSGRVPGDFVKDKSLFKRTSFGEYLVHLKSAYLEQTYGLIFWKFCILRCFVFFLYWDIFQFHSVVPSRCWEDRFFPELYSSRKNSEKVLGSSSILVFKMFSLSDLCNFVEDGYLEDHPS